MALEPKIPYTPAPFESRTCTKCGKSLPSRAFLKCRNPLMPDNHTTICINCLTAMLRAKDFDWRAVDKLCQLLDLPFIPAEWERLRDVNGDDNVLRLYAQIFQAQEYESIDWHYYYDQFCQLRGAGLLENELPAISDAKFAELRTKWGGNYDDEELLYLEDLYKGILKTQNVNGAMQVDQAQKLCKISLQIDSRIREGVDFDKLLASYDKLVKTADFTPKNAKNAADFDSVGEVFKWLEKRGWKNKFYDNVTRDVVDETIKNIQAYNQRLYTNETGIGDEITRRIEALKTVKEEENHYDIRPDYNIDEYENEGYEGLMKEDEIFKEDLD